MTNSLLFYLKSWFKNAVEYILFKAVAVFQTVDYECINYVVSVKFQTKCNKFEFKVEATVENMPVFL